MQQQEQENETQDRPVPAIVVALVLAVIVGSVAVGYFTTKAFGNLAEQQLTQED